MYWNLEKVPEKNTKNKMWLSNVNLGLSPLFSLYWPLYMFQSWLESWLKRAVKRRKASLKIYFFNYKFTRNHPCHFLTCLYKDKFCDILCDIYSGTSARSGKILPWCVLFISLRGKEGAHMFPQISCFFWRRGVVWKYLDIK